MGTIEEGTYMVAKRATSKTKSRGNAAPTKSTKAAKATRATNAGPRKGLRDEAGATTKTAPKAAKGKTPTRKDVTQYADAAKVTPYHKAFAKWIVTEVGYDPDEAPSKRNAFLRGVAIATAARPAFMDSDFLEQWREENGVTKRGPKGSADAETTRKRSRAVVSDEEFDDTEVEEDDEDLDDEDLDEDDDFDSDEDDDESDDEDDEDDEDEDDDEDDEDEDDEDDEDDEEEEEVTPAPRKRGRPAKATKAAPAKAVKRAPAKAAKSAKSAKSTKGKTTTKAKGRRTAKGDDDTFLF